MKGKLINRGNNDYKLYVNEIPYATTDNSPYKKLSKQNCDEIFGVVDVEKLIKEADTSHLSNWTSDSHEIMFDEGFKMGFAKKAELNKDKVFSEEQMFRMFLFGHSLSEAIKRGVIEDKPVGEIFDDRIKFIQQPTEIEVMIITEVDLAGHMTNSTHPGAYLGTDTGIPLLDSNECLILKKI